MHEIYSSKFFIFEKTTVMRILFSFILLLVTLELSAQSINKKFESPKKAYSYPKFTESDSLRGGLNEFRRNYDVRHYDLSLDFNLKKKSIKGRVIMTFLAVEDLTKIQLDLKKNLDVLSVSFEDSELNIDRRLDFFWVNFNRTIKKDETVSLTISYEGKPQKAIKPPWEGGFVYKKDRQSNPWVSVACEVLGASSWWPCKDHLSDEPDSMDMHYTIPEGLFCAANGKLISSNSEGEKSTFNWKVHYPINTYNVTFYIGNYQHFEYPYENESGMHRLEFYVLPDFQKKAEQHFKQSAKILHYFEDYFGEYPWWKDGFRLVTSPFAGMEHQSAIAYGEKMENGQCGMDHLMVHEMAHEWWGNSITVSDYADIWLQEGFATYSEVLYSEHKIGEERAQDHMKPEALMIQNHHPLVGPKDVNYWSYKNPDPYLKGSWTLHSFRNTLNDDSLFMDIIKSWYQEHKLSIVTSKDFIDHVNKETGDDYTWFFNQYLYNWQSPKFQYYFERDSSSPSNILHFKWTDVVDDFKMPCYILDGEEWVRIYPTTGDATYSFKNPKGKFEVSHDEFYFNHENKKY